MKKITIVLVALFTFNIVLAQNIKGVVTYKVSLNSDNFLKRLEKDNEMPEFRRKSRLKDLKTATPTNFQLFFNGQESLYKSEFDLPTKRRLGMIINKTASVAMDHFTYYVNIKSKERLSQSFWLGKVLVNMNPIDWNLTQETKKIGKYICYKATTVIDSEQTFGMNFMSPIVAWYTPQIPVPFGIQNFGGLPGLTLELIVEVEKGKLFYKATKIELNPKRDIEIKRLKGKQISEKEYVELIKQMNGNRG